MDHGNITDSLKESVGHFDDTIGGGKSIYWNVNSESAVGGYTLPLEPILQVDGCDDMYMSPGGSPTPGSDMEVDLEHDGNKIQVIDSTDQGPEPSFLELVGQGSLERGSL